MLDRTNHIIFATNFSDACHAAIPSVARWVDALGCRLTLLHIYNPDRVLYREAEALLRSFFAEADNYPQCERVLMNGDAATDIADLCAKHRDGLLMLPPSDQAGLPRPWHRSLRARLMRKIEIPIWTLGRTMVGEVPPATSESHIGVWVANTEEGTSHVWQAARYAANIGATLHLLHIVPEIHEGSLAHTLLSDSPLGEPRARDWLASLAEDLQDIPKVEVHVAQGSSRRHLPRLLRQSGVDMLITSQQSAVEQGFFRSEVSSIFRACKAGIVCVPHHSKMQGQLNQALSLKKLRLDPYMSRVEK